MAYGGLGGLGGVQPRTLNEWKAQQQAAERARVQQMQGALQNGGWDAVFAGQQGRDPSGALAAGNTFYNPLGTAAAYTPEQVQRMAQQMPMRMGETNQMLYKGQLYNAPLTGGMQMLNALSPQQQQQMAQQVIGAGAGTFREQGIAGGGGGQVPPFTPAGGQGMASGGNTTLGKPAIDPRAGGHDARVFGQAGGAAPVAPPMQGGGMTMRTQPVGMQPNLGMGMDPLALARLYQPNNYNQGAGLFNFGLVPGGFGSYGSTIRRR